MGIIYSKLKKWKKNRNNQKTRPRQNSNNEKEATSIDDSYTNEQNSLMRSYMGTLGSNSFYSNILGSDVHKTII